jgi:hypothetical protein
MDSQPLGPVLHGLGCTVRLRPGDLVCSAVVLLEVFDQAGAAVLRICDSEGMSWLARRGMLETALDAERGIHATRPTAG